MKKLVAAIAIAAAFGTPALAQSGNANAPRYMRPQIMVHPVSEPLGSIQGDIGVATDPDANVRLDLHRNFDHYAHGTGG